MIIRSIEFTAISQFLILQVFSYYYPDNYQEPPRSKYPYLVSIRRSQHFSSHICSGSLVAFSWILTSADCIFDYVKSPKMLHISAGKPNSEEEQMRKCEKIFYHDQFSKDTFKNDIGLLKLEKPFSKNPSIGICYTPEYTMHIEVKIRCEQVLVLGFDVNKFAEDHLILLAFNHTVHTDEECARKYKELHIAHTFCGDAENMTACIIDKGGPAICESMIYGVIFYGCPWSEFPSYFTRVDRNLMFIEKIMGKEAPFPVLKRGMSKTIRNKSQLDNIIMVLLIFLIR